MNPLSILWIEIIKRPIFNLLLVLLVLFGGNLGRAVIVLTLVIRLLLVKNAMAAGQMQGQMGDFQPKMQRIQEQHKDDPQKMSQEMMNLFKKSGGGPLKGCLTMLVQIPVFLGLFYTVKDLTAGTLNVIPYSFLSHLEVDFTQLETIFFGIDLLTPQNIVLTILAGILMYGQMQMTTMVKGKQTPKIPGMSGNENMPDMGKMMGGMNIFFVFMMAMFVRTMPSAIGLYIVTTTLFGVIQQTIQFWPALKAKYRARRGTPEIIEGE